MHIHVPVRASVETLVSCVSRTKAVSDGIGIGTRSLRLWLCCFSYSFLVSFLLLQLQDALLKWIDRELFFQLMLFNALHHSLHCRALSLIGFILQQKRKGKAQKAIVDKFMPLNHYQSTSTYYDIEGKQWLAIKHQLKEEKTPLSTCILLLKIVLKKASHVLYIFKQDVFRGG